MYVLIQHNLHAHARRALQLIVHFIIKRCPDDGLGRDRNM